MSVYDFLMLNNSDDQLLITVINKSNGKKVSFRLEETIHQDWTQSITLNTYAIFSGKDCGDDLEPFIMEIYVK